MPMSAREPHFTECRWCDEITSNPDGLCSKACREEYYGESDAEEWLGDETDLDEEV